MQKSGFRFIQDLFGAISRRVKLGSDPQMSEPYVAIDRLLKSCHLLLTYLGEASKIAVAEQALLDYEELNQEQRESFFQHLDDDFGVNPTNVRSAYEKWNDSVNSKTLNRLFEAVEPKRQALLRQLNLTNGATLQLMKMRADLLAVTNKNPQLTSIDNDFFHLFRSWFNRGFLVLKRIDWDAPASILEKIVQYEAVHKIDGWHDLRRRLDEKDRRCYGFFHPATGDEPLIFVEVALCQGTAKAISPLLSGTYLPHQAPFDTAVFYSISNCQRGLKGISFGNFLIKQVVVELSQEIPELVKFATLSPVPGFAKWASLQAENEPDVDKLIRMLSQSVWHEDEASQDEIRSHVLQLVARYIIATKTSSKSLLDPVAKFHLGNGACVDDIIWPADLSKKGLSESYGVMINYWYEFSQIESRHEAFAQHAQVAMSDGVSAMLASKLSVIKGTFA